MRPTRSAVDAPRRDHISPTAIPTPTIVTSSAAAGGGIVIDLLRLMKAVHLDTRPRGGGGIWHVMGPDSLHVVHVAESGPICDCVDFQKGTLRCKHALRVDLANGDRDTIAALRRLLPYPSRRSARRRTRPNRPESPNSGGTGPGSRQTGARVGSGATNAGDPRGQSR